MTGIPHGVIGEYNEDGTTKTEAFLCAVSGVPVLDDHHTVQRLDATHFVRYASHLAPRFTEARRAELAASLIPQDSKKAAVAAKGER